MDSHIPVPGGIPRGWVKQESRSHGGRLYFFNPTENVSFWRLSEVLAHQKLAGRSAKASRFASSCLDSFCESNNRRVLCARRRFFDRLTQCEHALSHRRALISQASQDLCGDDVNCGQVLADPVKNKVAPKSPLVGKCSKRLDVCLGTKARDGLVRRHQVSAFANGSGQVSGRFSNSVSVATWQASKRKGSDAGQHDDVLDQSKSMPVQTQVTTTSPSSRHERRDCNQHQTRLSKKKTRKSRGGFHKADNRKEQVLYAEVFHQRDASLSSNTSVIYPKNTQVFSAVSAKAGFSTCADKSVPRTSVDSKGVANVASAAYTWNCGGSDDGDDCGKADDDMEWESSSYNAELVLQEIENIRHCSSPFAGCQSRVHLPVAERAEYRCAPPSLTIVVDTNILISHVDFVCDLLYCFIEGRRPHLLIPWIVLQELDRLKCATNESSSPPQSERCRNYAKCVCPFGNHDNKPAVVARAARAAISFLLAYFQSGNPHITGQRMTDARASSTFGRRSNADDAILQCCLLATRRPPLTAPPTPAAAVAADNVQSRVYLLSHDKNLMNKVLVHNIDARTCQQLQVASTLCDIGNFQNFAKESVKFRARFLLRCVLCHIVAGSTSESHLRCDCDGSLSHVSTAAGDCGRFEQPVCTSRALVRCITASRRSEFVSLTANDEQGVWRRLVHLTADFLSPGEIVGGDECGEGSAASLLTGLMQLLSAHDKYRALCGPVYALLGDMGATKRQWEKLMTIVAPSVEKLHNLSTGVRRKRQVQLVSIHTILTDRARDVGVPTQRASEVNMLTPPASEFVMSTERTSEVSMPTESNPAIDETQAVFERLWCFLHNSCGVLMDSIGIAHSLVYTRPSTWPSLTQCVAASDTLSTRSADLLSALRQLILLSVVSMDNRTPALLTCAECIANLVALAGGVSPVLPDQLLVFIKLPAKRLVLLDAIVQLENMVIMLNDARQSLLSVAS